MTRIPSIIAIGDAITRLALMFLVGWILCMYQYR